MIYNLDSTVIVGHPSLGLASLACHSMIYN